MQPIHAPALQQRPGENPVLFNEPKRDSSRQEHTRGRLSGDCAVAAVPERRLVRVDGPSERRRPWAHTGLCRYSSIAAPNSVVSGQFTELVSEDVKTHHLAAHSSKVSTAGGFLWIHFWTHARLQFPGISLNLQNGSTPELYLRRVRSSGQRAQILHWLITLVAGDLHHSRHPKRRPTRERH